MSEQVGLVNAGNTNTVFGTFDHGRVRRVCCRPTHECTVAEARRMLAEAQPRGGSWSALAIAAVVPRALERWIRAARRMRIPVFPVRGDMNPGVPVDVPRPSTLGADRLANVAGGLARWAAPFIVVDVGTAATFDVVTPDRGYVGGVIAPGPDMVRDVLAERTALLPRISRPADRPVSAVGRTTAEAMQIGTQVGYTGLVREILVRIRTEPGMQAAHIVFTGGGARRVVRDLGEPYPVAPELTLEGVAQLYRLNTGKSGPATEDGCREG